MKIALNFGNIAIKTSLIKYGVTYSARNNSNLVKITDFDDCSLRRIIMCNQKQRNCLGNLIY